ncbi:MAG: ureidoglycolate lyase [Proteobacteria bacterium]|nr:ureidoglycolate lyase [Pseudomonadota bacterium]
MTNIRLRAEPLTQEAFQPFGFVMAVPAEGKRTGPVPIIADRRSTAKVTANLIDLPVQTRPLQVRQVERHLNSAQYFLHLSGGPLSLVVFPAAADGRPDIAAARAFVAAPEQAFGYHPGTWHAGVAALSEAAKVASLLSRDGTAGDVEESTLDEAIEVDWT